MRILLNSDITHQGSLVRESLSARLVGFLNVCREESHTIVLARTVVLEFRRHQTDLGNKTASQIKEAIDLLTTFGIAVGPVDIGQVVTTRELDECIRELGVRCETLDPTSSELLGAHDRACLHKSPSQPDTKSDEMRDLVIWEMALRSAQSGQTLLVSRDKIHTGDLGKEEAEKVGLMRAKTIDDALDLLRRETPARRIIEELLTAVWGELRTRELSVPDECHVAWVREPSFEQGEGGLQHVGADISLRSEDADDLILKVEFEINRNSLRHVVLRPQQGSITELDVDVPLQSEWARSAAEIDERRTALKEVVND